MNAIAHAQSQATPNPRLHPFLIKGREFSYPIESYIPFFSNLTEQAISCLVKKSKALRYLRRWTMAAESDQNNSIFIIFSGKVNVVRGGAINSFLVQDTDSCFGEIAVLSGQLGSSSIVTFERTLFSTVTKDEFVNWLMTYPEVKLNLRECAPEKIN
jgi:CRP-like cAMP-binding protein